MVIRMLEFQFKKNDKNYEINDNQKYKRINIDFNEYGLNNQFELDSFILYNGKTGPNCVKRQIKR